MKNSASHRIVFSFLLQTMVGLLLVSPSGLAQEKQTASDQYCSYLQGLQAKVYAETKGPSAIENLIDFVNSLMKKVTLENLEKEAIQKKMTFEDFQKWAKDVHTTTVSDHYKQKYLISYMNEYCGTITNSATFGSAKEPELSATAEKQFDPKGHAYATEMLPTEVEKKDPASSNK